MPEPAIHPGKTLAPKLEALVLSASDLARALHVPSIRIARILNGKGGITADTALRLGRYFGEEPIFWLGLQRTYELRLAQQRFGAEIERRVVPRAGIPPEAA